VQSLQWRARCTGTPTPFPVSNSAARSCPDCKRQRKITESRGFYIDRTLQIFRASRSLFCLPET
jgi:hypothetical protein